MARLVRTLRHQGHAAAADSYTLDVSIRTHSQLVRARIRDSLICLRICPDLELELRPKRLHLIIFGTLKRLLALMVAVVAHFSGSWHNAIALQALTICPGLSTADIASHCEFTRSATPIDRRVEARIQLTEPMSWANAAIAHAHAELLALTDGLSEIDTRRAMFEQGAQMQAEDQVARATVNLGVAESAPQDAGMESVLKRKHAARYAAKSRNQVMRAARVRR